MTVKTIARAGLIAAALLAMPLSAQAQTAPLPNAVTSTSSFDAYRAAAITAGVIVGATVAVIVTEGLIIPAYAYVTGAGTTAATGAAAGAGTMAMASGPMAAGAGPMTAGAGHGYAFAHGVARLFGAISGGFIADSWYMSQ